MPRDVKILIAPPSPQKPRILQRTFQDELEGLEAAEEVFVLGYSFPNTDQDQRALVASAVKKRAAPIRRVTIVNFRASYEYFDDVEELLQPRKIRRFNDGFVDFVSKDL